jgi:hypothetical protein
MYFYPISHFPPVFIHFFVCFNSVFYSLFCVSVPASVVQDLPLLADISSQLSFTSPSFPSPIPSLSPTRRRLHDNPRARAEALGALLVMLSRYLLCLTRLIKRYPAMQAVATLHATQSKSTTSVPTVRDAIRVLQSHGFLDSSGMANTLEVAEITGLTDPAWQARRRWRKLRDHVCQSRQRCGGGTSIFRKLVKQAWAEKHYCFGIVMIVESWSTLDSSSKQLLRALQHGVHQFLVVTTDQTSANASKRLPVPSLSLGGVYSGTGKKRGKESALAALDDGRNVGLGKQITNLLSLSPDDPSNDAQVVHIFLPPLSRHELGKFVLRLANGATVSTRALCPAAKQVADDVLDLVMAKTNGLPVLV